MTPKPCRILLVEDDSGISRVIAISMHDLSIPYQLDQALSAEEGLELWKQEPYDLLLTDYNLRGMSGLALIAELRQSGSTAPMVLFTAYDTPQTRREARALGVSKFIPKPFLLDEFVAIVRGLLPKDG